MSFLYYFDNLNPHFARDTVYQESTFVIGCTENTGGGKMETFNLIAGICSIVGFVLTLIVTGTVLKIKASISGNSNTVTGSQTIKGSGNKQAGRDLEG